VSRPFWFETDVVGLLARGSGSYLVMGCCASQDDGKGKERKHEMPFYCHGLDLL
jgi:hypothetical protein